MSVHTSLRSLLRKSRFGSMSRLPAATGGTGHARPGSAAGRRAECERLEDRRMLSGYTFDYCNPYPAAIPPGCTSCPCT